jgi:hypothetical protein
MSRRASRTVRTVAVLAVLALTAAYIWGVINGEATAVTAATAILVFALGEFFRRRLASQQYRWDKIAPQYETLLSHLRKVTNATAEERVGLAEETEAIMGKFGDELLLWASPKVIQAWVAMRRLSANGPPPVEEQIRAYGKLLLAIRREFGHSDWSLTEADLFRVIFNDELETLIAQAKAEAEQETREARPSE